MPATIMEILKEELQMKGMKTTGENLEKIFNDEKIVSHMGLRPSPGA